MKEEPKPVVSSVPFGKYVPSDYLFTEQNTRKKRMFPGILGGCLWFHSGLALTLCSLLLVPPAARAQTAQPARNEGTRWVQQKKVILLFSIDQGFGNGMAANGDLVGLSNMVKALEPLREKYQVCALLNPHLKKNMLKLVLDRLVELKMPFVFDVYTSDTFTLGANCLADEPYDPSHGLSVSVEQLATYKEAYGPWLVGVRFMEVFGQDFVVRTMKGNGLEGSHGNSWETTPKRPGDKIPADNVFQPRIAEGYIRFAKDHDMFVQWADFQWVPFAPWDKEMPGYEKQLEELLHKYPGVVTVTYNNNEPNEASLQHLGIWQTAVENFPKEGAAGFGLSDQSWLRNFHPMETTPEDMIAWAKSALDKHCALIQFEPAWYFFSLPSGTFECSDYTQDPKWANRGAATESLKKLIAFLLAPPVTGNRAGK